MSKKKAQEILDAAEQQLRNAAQDRVLGEMARKGITLEQFTEFDLMWARLKSNVVNSYKPPAKKLVETMDEMDALVLELRRCVQALARVSRGEADVTMDDIATAGLMLDCRWDFKTEKL